MKEVTRVKYIAPKTFSIKVKERKGFPVGSVSKESACDVRDLGAIPGLGRCPGEGKGYPLQRSGLENFMDYTVHGVAKSWILSLSLSKERK